MTKKPFSNIAANEDPFFMGLDEDIAEVLGEIKHAPVTPGLQAMHNASKDAHSPRTDTPAKRVRRAEKIAKILDTREYTGGSTSYYQLDIEHPVTPKRKPYTVECYDIIEALGMSYSEGNVLKALWRMCAARQGKSKRGYDDAKYDAEKLVYCSNRILEEFITPKGNKS